jgi:hypothetical protein
VTMSMSSVRSRVSSATVMPRKTFANEWAPAGGDSSR